MNHNGILDKGGILTDLLDMEKGEKQKVARKVLMQLAQRLDYMMLTDTQTYNRMRK